MSFESDFLGKLEIIVTNFGGTVPVMSTPASFDGRVLALLDALISAVGGGSGSLADGSVSTTKLADGAVTTPKLADGAVTPAKTNFGAALTFPAPGGVFVTSAVNCINASSSGAAHTVFAGNLSASSSQYAAWLFNNTQIGSVTTNGVSVAYNTSSDYRLKENVVPLVGALPRLLELSPCRFNFIDHPEQVDGFIAHEVQTVVPEAVTGEYNAVNDLGEPIYQGIDQAKLVPLLVAAIQELEARVTTLGG